MGSTLNNPIVQISLHSTHASSTHSRNFSSRFVSTNVQQRRNSRRESRDWSRMYFNFAQPALPTKSQSPPRRYRFIQNSQPAAGLMSCEMRNSRSSSPRFRQGGNAREKKKSRKRGEMEKKWRSTSFFTDPSHKKRDPIGLGMLRSIFSFLERNRSLRITWPEKLKYEECAWDNKFQSGQVEPKWQVSPASAKINTVPDLFSNADAAAFFPAPIYPDWTQVGCGACPNILPIRGLKLFVNWRIFVSRQLRKFFWKWRRCFGIHGELKIPRGSPINHSFSRSWLVVGEGRGKASSRDTSMVLDSASQTSARVKISSCARSARCRNANTLCEYMNHKRR